MERRAYGEYLDLINLSRLFVLGFISEPPENVFSDYDTFSFTLFPHPFHTWSLRPYASDKPRLSLSIFEHKNQLCPDTP